MTQSAGGWLARVERAGTAVENAALVILLAAMMIVAVGQIAMRLLFSSGFVWADELLKLMVLWIAMIASVAAARNARHLRIDLLTHFVPPRLARVPRIVAEGFAAAVCGVLARQSWLYVQLEREFGDTVLIDTPAWLAHGIVPLGFALMTWHFAKSVLRESVALLRNEPEAKAP